MTFTLTKHHGLGNDFLIGINPEPAFAPEDAVRICDRRTGVGADGLIGLTPFGKGWKMVLYNSDGSRPEISGNGLRCVGQALAMHESLQLAEDESHTFAVITDAGPRGVTVFADDGPNVTAVQVAMGVAGEGPDVWGKWDSLEVEVANEATVDMGNPHLVAQVADPWAVDLGVVGPAVEADYPDGLNVHFIRPTGPNSIELSVWERGAGITQACGTGACAAAYAATDWGLVQSPVEVVQPGGVATVLVSDDGISLRGPAAYIGQIVVPA